MSDQLTVAESIRFYERQVDRAGRDAARRGVRQPALAPEVLEAKSFLRYWCSVRDRRARAGRCAA